MHRLRDDGGRMVISAPDDQRGGANLAEPTYDVPIFERAGHKKVTRPPHDMIDFISRLVGHPIQTVWSWVNAAATVATKVNPACLLILRAVGRTRCLMCLNCLLHLGRAFSYPTPHLGHPLGRAGPCIGEDQTCHTNCLPQLI